MSASVALAVSLARPVVRGLLPLAHAEAAIATGIAREIRTGLRPADTDAAARIRIDTHILNLHIARLEERCDATARAIDRTIRPLIEQRQPIGRVRAESHNCNEDAGFVLTEQAVEDAVVHALYQARARAGANPPPSLRRPRRYHAG